MNILELIKKLIADHLEISQDSISESDQLGTEGLGLDSLETPQLIIDLEDKLEIDIPDDFEVKDNITVGELVKKIEELI